MIKKIRRPARFFTFLVDGNIFTYVDDAKMVSRLVIYGLVVVFRKLSFETITSFVALRKPMLSNDNDNE